MAEDNPFSVITSLAIWVFSFIYFIDFGYFVILSSEEQIYLFIWFYFYHGWLVFCLSYFALNKHTINSVTCFFLLIFFRVTSNQQFCRWRCFSFYWFGKQEFGKFSNEIPVNGGPVHTPRLNNCMCFFFCFWKLPHDYIMLYLIMELKYEQE